MIEELQEVIRLNTKYEKPQQHQIDFVVATRWQIIELFKLIQ